MNIFHFLAAAQFLKLVKTLKRISSVKNFDTFFKTRDMIPLHLLESLIMGMVKRFFEVNREK